MYKTYRDTPRRVFSPCADLAIITAIAPGRDAHLAETAESVRELRAHLPIQWILVWDGEPTSQVDGTDVIVYGRHGSGIACTRNLALPHVAAPLVTSLDADDLIVVEGARAARDRLVADPSLGWVGLSRTFLDGSPTKHALARQRIFAPGELAESWSSPFLFHPNSVVMRSELLCGQGGWPAVASNEDLGLVLRMSEEAAGVLIPDVLTRYRVWDRQEVARSSYVEVKQLAFAYLETTLNARRHASGRPDVNAPDDPGEAFGRQQVIP